MAGGLAADAADYLTEFWRRRRRRRRRRRSCW
jgi:hypothetical protein